MTAVSKLPRRLELCAIIEGTSLLVLVGVAVPLKHVFGVAFATPLLGPLHGIAFLAYVAAVLEAFATRQLTGRRAALAVLAAMIPTGSFLFLRSLRARGS
jgi:integral membrane protein